MHQTNDANTIKNGNVEATFATPNPLHRQYAQSHLRYTETDIESTIELTTTLTSSSRANNTPERSLSTDSETAMPDGSDVVVAVENIENAEQERALSLAKRIVKNYELRYMARLPDNTTDNRLRYKTTSIITRDGLYQVNQEINEFRRILTVRDLYEINPDLTKERESTEPEGVLIYDELTLEQLNQLEGLVRDHRGYGVIGYSINEEVFLKLVGLGYYEYPPMPDSYPKEVLNLINKPITRDVSISLQTMVQSYIVFNYLMRTGYEYDNKSDDAYYDFSIANTQWFLIALSSIVIINLSLLRSGCIDKEALHATLNRLILILSSMIGSAQNWTSYPKLIPLVFQGKSIPPDIINGGFIPALMYGAYCGRFDKNELFTLPVVNISKRTEWNTFWYGLSYACTAGSLWSLGLIYPINTLFFLHKDMSEHKVNVEFTQDLMTVQYAVLILTILAQIARYPLASAHIRKFGVYSSNVINGLSYTLLNSGASFIFTGMIATLLFGNNPSPSNTGVTALDFISQTTILIYAFMTTFPTTRDLANYSIEPIPKGESTCNRVKNYILIAQNHASQCINFSSHRTENHSDSTIERTDVESGVQLSGIWSSFFSNRTKTLLSAPSAQTATSPQYPCIKK